MKNLFAQRRNFLAFTGIAFAVIIFSSCLKSKDNDNVNNQVSALMAFNLSPDKPSIGITLSGNNLTNSPLLYTNYTGAYVNIYSGSRNISAYDAGTGTGFTSSNYTFDTSKYYSLFVVGNNSRYSNLVVQDNFDSLSGTSGKAYIRYVNAIADSSQQPLVKITDNQNTVINQNAVFPSASAFTAVNAGQVTIDINNDSTIHSNRTITLDEKKVYTALLLGVPGGTNAGDSIQIKYIENGTLQDSAQQARSNNGRSIKVN